MAISTTAAVNGSHGSEKVNDVCVVGAGPAGLMLSVVLARLGLSVKVLDERPDQTSVGRADGIQPKTIETLQMLGLGDELLRQGVRVYDICMWATTDDGSIKRQGRETHYPKDVVDVLHPFILLCHQGMVEKTLLDDMSLSGLDVEREQTFQTYRHGEDGLLHIESCGADSSTSETQSHYLVGCDGARSAVRKAIPGTYSEGSPHNSVWGVLDGELVTDFPDIWSKTLVHSHEHGTLLIIPRERNMTRLYIEMKNSGPAKGLGEEFVMEQARRVLQPYQVEWKTVEWFGNYAVSQRVAARFSDPELKAFIAGDASHSHSPKAAQGLNTSVHDSWNLAWKLNLASRGLSAGDDILLRTYEDERKKIAHDLIDFDFEHANQIAGGDPKLLAENFRKNTKFISGVGVEYGRNVINQGTAVGSLAPGLILPPAKVTRFIDANPVHVQLDIPVLGQFRIYFIAADLGRAAGFLSRVNDLIASESSLLSRLSRAAAESYTRKPRAARSEDVFRPSERYTSASHLFTYALITSTDKNQFELASLPSLLSSSPWTVYLDNAYPSVSETTHGCIEKWLGACEPNTITILNVRPDGYVGSVCQWENSDMAQADKAAQWLEAYYGGFLAA
ncbi:hypothetical protein NLU13_7883 [Sarocladium strictum]|uniref:FAD binding domain-containing protein n=1 Tax=Sarocladium strictum TaxID=5046 RepID=A0AA39GFZ8_SARSR|nr:hypothetical protein NLU13_7883 [Sarocladium strictum]